ncbi:MAG: formate dehydrogenase accessory sulfurtransferase FdhD [Planctomycetes bacterium]|nr:formate dehydrogenase accessory sulfurtransferase FdhD [Planctomycetota bacterium]
MTPRRNLAKVAIQKIKGSATTKEKDLVAVEEPLEIRLAGETAGKKFDRSLAVTMRTPGDDYELAAGFLFTEGVLRAPEDLREITYCVGAHKLEQQYNVVRVRLRPGTAFDAERLQRNFYTSSSCGVCGKASLESIRTSGAERLPDNGFTVAPAVIHKLSEELRKRQSVFEKTGGIHAAALFDAAGALLAQREDVGRHNAVDKVIGEMFLAQKLPLNRHILFVSGRTSFEIMQKAVMASIPVVASVGAPSSLAVELAREFNQTLLGFVRDGRFNVYAGESRISGE